jgi:hypothetical protein
MVVYAYLCDIYPTIRLAEYLDLGDLTMPSETGTHPPKIPTMPER